MNEQASPQVRRQAAIAEAVQLVVETSSWVAAWLIFPVWLAARGTGAGDFLAYALGAGLLLALGVAADRTDAFPHPSEAAWFTAASCLAVVFVGGPVFAVAAALLA